MANERKGRTKPSPRRIDGRRKPGLPSKAKTHTEPDGAPALASLETEPPEPQPTPGVPIVGIVASAGGLDAFKNLLKAMPSDSGMAFVLVPHLDPMQKSLMAPLLARHTRMPVAEVDDGTRAEPNHVYVIPPNCYLALHEGILHLTSPVERALHQTAIDGFLRSLADDQQERAICIVLSGTGSLGTLGLKAVKANGGLAMVQDPRTAEYGQMPQNAIATGLADYVLPVEQMPEALQRYLRHFVAEGAATRPETGAGGEMLSQVVAFLRAHTNFDFRTYRKAMLVRRIQRRMNLNHVEQIKDYITLLREHPEELKQLTKDLLISVTSFFRDREMYRVLETEVIPDILRACSSERPIRVWVPGCATGEEAYSIAMVLFEAITAAQKVCPVQIFATDIDVDALQIARQGSYQESLLADVAPERIARFFLRTDAQTYQVNKQLREAVLFAQQNILSDAPFSRIDLVSCRNVLIYLEPQVQQKLVALVHFALRGGGYLVLGPSESVGAHSDLFEPMSKKWRIFRRISVPRKVQLEFPISAGDARTGYSQPASVAMPAQAAAVAELTLQKLVDDYAPAAVVANSRHEVVYFSGVTHLYLQQPSGVPTQDVLALARPGLRARLRAVMQKAVREGERVSISGGHVRREGRQVSVRVTAEPLRPPRDSQGLMLITFEDERRRPPPGKATPVAEVDEALVSQLEHELKSSREELHSTIEELESSNEELKASTEEVMSMNEELQSANEELETSKEELQSLNEELSTVNSQLRDKVEELEAANNDMANLLASTDIATVFLGADGRIKRFTAAATRLFNLIPSDVGRPIGDLTSRFSDPELAADIEAVLATLAPLQREVSTPEDWYLRRVTPYRTSDNRIEGVVVTLTEISRIKQAESELRQLAGRLEDLVVERTSQLVAERDFASGILDTVDAAIYVLDRAGRIARVNAAFETISGYSFAEVEGKTLIETLVPNEEAGAFNACFTSLLAGNTPNRREGRWLRKDGSQRWISSSKRVLRRNASGEIELIIGSAIDRTAERMADHALHAERNFVVSLLETSAALILVLDLEGRISRVNKAFAMATGYESESLVSRPLWDLLPEQEVGPVKEAFAKAGDQCLAQGYESHLLHRDGSRRAIEWVATCHADAAQQPQYFVVTGIDITAKQFAEEESRNRAAEVIELHRRYMASGIGIVVAHELSQPLSAIANYAEAGLRRFARETVPVGDVVNDLEQIRAQAHRAASVIEELRSLVGKSGGRTQPANLSELVRSACQLFDFEARRRGIQIVSELAEGLPPVLTDQIRVEHVLLNLFQNASDAILEAGRQHGKITVATGSRVNEAGISVACVTVRDDGAGVSADVAERAFERFFTSKARGIGMGLPISRALVEAQGGRVWIEPAEGQGIVHFTLPFAS